MTTRRLRLRRGDREIEIEGDAAFVEANQDRFVSLVFGDPSGDSRSSSLPHVSPTFSVRKNLSFEDFTELKDPRTDLDRLLVLAYYQERYESRDSYTVDDLRAAWEAAWPERAWEPRLSEEGLERGFFQWKAEGCLTLSFLGENYVRDGLA